MTRAALIGVGMVADMHVVAIRATQGAISLCGVMARRFANAQRFAQKHDIMTAYSDIAAVLADAPDFVILATPPDARLEYISTLAKAGVPVLAEKPLERDAERARDLVRICQSNAVPFGAILQHRMRPASQDLIQLVENNTLGDIASVELRVPWWRDQSYYDAPGRGTFERDGGGVMITQAIHQIDLMLQLCGPVESVAAMTTTTPLHELDAEDFAGAVFRFASGAIGTLVASVTHYPGGSEMLVLNGTRGSATLSADCLVVHQHGQTAQVFGQSGAATGGGADPMAFSHAWHQAVIEDFADALKHNRPPTIPAASALSAQALIDAIHRASRTGQVTTVEASDV